MLELTKAVLGAVARAGEDYPDLIDEIDRNLRDWCLAPGSNSPRSELIEFLEKAPAELIADCFRRRLPFGTGGRRGEVGIGSNKINLHTLALTVIGHVKFLRSRQPTSQLRVIVANDTRVYTDIRGRYAFMNHGWSLRGASSRSLAIRACSLYETLGVRAYINEPDSSDAFMATPELSFSIREFAADGGLNVSASHNHPDDNGLKVYTESGGQYCPPEDENLADFVMQASQGFELPSLTPSPQDVRALNPALHNKYVSNYVAADKRLCRSSKPYRTSHRVVYTPMCGTGGDSVGQVLEMSGYAVRTPPDQFPDGTFASIPMRSPNPEILGVTQPAIEYANQVGSGIVLSTDPDADRLGLEVRDVSGRWRHLTGNQIAVIIGYFLFADPAGPKLDGQLITTIATTRALRAIARISHQPICDDLLIGFKFIGQFMDDRPSDEGRTVFAAEESHGYLTTDLLRDKDAASAAFILAHLHCNAAESGTTLWDYLLKIYSEIGVHAEIGRSLVFLGADGAAKIDSLMVSLRSRPIERLGAQPVRFVNDFLETEFGPIRSNGEASARDLLEISTEHFRVVVRPSGTEPKLKYYFDYVGDNASQGGNDHDQALATVAHAAASLYKELAERAGYIISEAGLAESDTIPVSEKASPLTNNGEIRH